MALGGGLGVEENEEEEEEEEDEWLECRSLLSEDVRLADAGDELLRGVEDEEEETLDTEEVLFKIITSVSNGVSGPGWTNGERNSCMLTPCG